MNQSSEFLLRSLLFVPAHNDRLLDSAARLNADVLLLDLEDSVQPVENKQIARNKIIERVQRGDFAKHHVFPRINDRKADIYSKITSLAIPGIADLCIQSKKGEDIYFIDKLLETIEFENLPVGTFKLIPLIETTEQYSMLKTYVLHRNVLLP